MGKRSDFKRRKNDAYMTTDPKSVVSLLYFLGTSINYYEPCVGKGDLVRLLLPHRCIGSSDMEKDARSYKYDTSQFEYFITNPPWTRRLLHPIIENLRVQAPTWLLFDSDWAYTKQSAPYIKYCKYILPIGRVKWIPNSKHLGKDNCSWYLFVDKETTCTFIPRDY